MVCREGVTVPGSGTQNGTTPSNGDSGFEIDKTTIAIIGVSSIGATYLATKRKRRRR